MANVRVMLPLQIKNEVKNETWSVLDRYGEKGQGEATSQVDYVQKTVWNHLFQIPGLNMLQARILRQWNALAENFPYRDGVALA